MDTFLIKNRKRGMQATVQLRTPRTERNDKTEERERNDLAERNDFKKVGNPVRTDTKGEQY